MLSSDITRQEVKRGADGQITGVTLTEHLKQKRPEASRLLSSLSADTSIFHSVTYQRRDLGPLT